MAAANTSGSSVSTRKRPIADISRLDGSAPSTSLAKNQRHSPKSPINLRLYTKAKQALIEKRFHEAKRYLGQLATSNYAGIGVDRRVQAIYMLGKIQFEESSYLPAISNLTKVMTHIREKVGSDKPTDREINCHLQLGIAHVKKTLQGSFFEPSYLLEKPPTPEDVELFQASKKASEELASYHLQKATTLLKATIAEKTEDPEELTPTREIFNLFNAKFFQFLNQLQKSDKLPAITTGRNLLGLDNGNLFDTYDTVLERIETTIKKHPFKADFAIQTLLQTASVWSMMHHDTGVSHFAEQSEIATLMALHLSKLFSISSQTKAFILKRDLTISSNTSKFLLKHGEEEQKKLLRDNLENAKKRAIQFLQNKSNRQDEPIIYLNVQKALAKLYFLLDEYEKSKNLFEEIVPTIARHSPPDELYEEYYHYIHNLMDEGNNSESDKLCKTALKLLHGKITPHQLYELKFLHARNQVHLNLDAGLTLLLDLAKHTERTPRQMTLTSFSLAEVYFHKEEYQSAIDFAKIVTNNSLEIYPSAILYTQFVLLKSYFETGQRHLFATNFDHFLSDVTLPHANPGIIIELFTIFKEIVPKADQILFHDAVKKILRKPYIPTDTKFHIDLIAADRFTEEEAFFKASSTYKKCLESPLSTGFLRLETLYKHATVLQKQKKDADAKESLDKILNTELDDIGGSAEEKEKALAIYNQAKELIKTFK